MCLQSRRVQERKGALPRSDDGKCLGMADGTRKALATENRLSRSAVRLPSATVDVRSVTWDVYRCVHVPLGPIRRPTDAAAGLYCPSAHCGTLPSFALQCDCGTLEHPKRGPGSATKPRSTWGKLVLSTSRPHQGDNLFHKAKIPDSWPSLIYLYFKIEEMLG